ncbi:HYR domain-containing protein [Neolewinella litorea]|uniref:HYR domain-containing protein n=1 Tax=Neolewinella litorea TaxID=2562452 RepID=A0A4S4N8E7_9BACT|nr:HYR domain-containing protein [Neolewinella litorea]THH35482.1 HYR domain-containing protein [Neolewinella litorea]
MKCFTTLFLLLISLALSAQAGTIRVVAPCFGPDTVNFSYDATVDGRNQYIDDDGDPTTNSSLRIAYNPLLMRWEIRVINDAQFVFYATGTNSFAPDPPSSLAATYHGTNLCPPPLDAPVSVTGTGTQDTAGPDPCSAAGGDDDNDGVCNDVDACPGFDDKLDRDGDGAPDGCDPTFDGVAVTSYCFGGITLDFVQTGTDHTGRNIYTNALQGMEVAFNPTAVRWEVRVVSDPATVFYSNSVASLPDPPSSTFESYTGEGLCSQTATVTGGGTQDTRCLVDEASCDDGNDCTTDFLDVDCVCQNVDDTPPEALCQDVTVYLDEFGTATLTPEAVDMGSSDDCGAVTLSLDRTLFTCTDLGDVNLMVTLTVTDGASLTDECMARVTVLDNLPPAASDPATSTYACDSDVPAPDPAVVIGEADNCGPVQVSYVDETDNGAIGNAANSRIIVRRYQVADGSGNAVEVFHTIKVIDDEPPVITCQDVTLELGADGTVQFNPLVDGPGVVSQTDNCGLPGGVGFTGPTVYTCANLGPNPITIFKNDINGNQTTCTITLTIVDTNFPCNQPPVASCQNITVPADADCQGTALAQAFDFDSTDPDGDPLTFSVSPAGPYGLGVTNVTLTVTDDKGAESTCTATVTVVDEVPPAVTCVATPQNRNNDPGECFYTAQGTEFDATATDNCGNLTITNDYNHGSTLAGERFPVGTTMVTFSASDPSGNHSEPCSIEVTVTDIEFPTASCQNVIVQLNAAGVGTTTAEAVNNSSSDACGIAEMSLSQTTFGCDDLGQNPVTLTVTDVNGNSSVCNAIVTVQDNIPPTVLCQPIDVFMGLGGNYTLTNDDIDAIDAGSTDNCAVSSLWVIPNNFSALGTFNVTLTAQDASGNSDDCQTTVRVLKRPTTLVYQGEESVQYSDTVALQALLTDDLSGGGIAGQTVVFTIGDQTVSATTETSGVATASLLIDQEPSAGCDSDPVNGYDVDVTYAGTATMYQPSSDEDIPFTIEPEDARITYTGALFVATSSKNSSTADVLLSATIRDISLTPDASGDTAPGDIGYATVDFIDRDGGVINATPIPVVPIDPGDPTVGIAVYTWAGVDIGNADSESFAIGIRVCGYYSRDAVEDDEVITISKPLDNFVTGGGYLILESSAGPLAGDAGSKNNFGFNIRYNKAGTRLQGNIRTLIRRTEADGVRHTYQVKGNRMTSLAFDPNSGQAIFYGKANVQDVTDPNNPVFVFGNGDFQVVMTDNGEPGDMDLIGLTLYDNDGGLRYASHWDGTQTVQQLLGGGNLQVHAGKGGGGGNRKANNKSANDGDDRPASAVEVSPQLEVYPNPATGSVKVSLTALPSETRIILFDLRGRKVWEREVEAGESSLIIDLSSAHFVPGVYTLSAIGEWGLQTRRLLIQR